MVAFGDLTRRALVASLAMAPPLIPPTQQQQQLTLDLKPGPSGALQLPVSVGGSTYACAVDTGSPFLLVPSQPSLEARSREVLPPTTEIYGANRDGKVMWREATDFAAQGPGGTGSVVFGAADAGLVQESGGALLGLIRDVNALPGATWTPSRPTFFSQARRAIGVDVASFRIDAPARRLTLSSTPLLPAAADALPLVDPRRYGDGVAHYAVLVERLCLDGSPVRMRRPILAVFDSGLTGCVFSQSFVDELPLLADQLRTAPSRSRVGAVELTLRTERGQLRTLRASRETSPLFYTQVVELNWFAGGGPSVARARQWAGTAASFQPGEFDGGGNVAGRRPTVNARGVRRGSPPRAPHIIALGQAFLGSAVLTIDIDQRRAEVSVS